MNRSSPSPTRARNVLLACAALGLLVLIVALPFARGHRLARLDVETDFMAEYAPYANRIRHGDFPATFSWKGPGYHILLALTGLLVPDLFLAGKILSLLAGFAFVALTACAARRAGGPAAAVAAAILVAVQPLVVLMSWSVGTDMVFAALALASLVPLLAPGGTVSRGRLVAAGLIGGWALLTRPNGLFLLPAAAAVLWLATADRGRALAARIAAFAGLLLVPTGAWYLLHHLLHGGWPKNLNYRNIAAAAFPDLVSMTPDVYRETIETQFTGLGDVLRTRGGDLVLGTLKNIPDHAVQDANLVLGWGVTLLAIAGVYALVRAGRRDAWSLPAAGLFSFLALAPLYYEPRFDLFLAAPAAVLAAAAVVDFRSGALRSAAAGGRWVILAIGLAAAGWTLTVALQRSRAQLEAELPVAAIREAAAVVRSHPEIPGAVAARKPHAAWYAGRTYSGIPDVPVAALADTLRARGVGFLLLSPIEVEMKPELFELTRPDGVPPGLQPMWVRESVLFCILFRIMPSDAPAAIPANVRTGLDRLGETLAASGIEEHLRSRMAVYDYHRAAWLVSQRKFTEAIPLLESILKTAPDSPESNMYLGHALVETGRFQEGLDHLDRARALGISDRNVTINRAKALLALGRLDEARTELNAALERRPDDPVATYNLGFLASRENRAARAESLMTVAVRNGYAVDTSYRVTMGQVKLQLGKAAEAETLLAEGVRLNPENASLWLLHGFALMQLGRSDEAVPAFRRVLEIDPANAYARDYLSKLGG